MKSNPRNEQKVNNFSNKIIDKIVAEPPDIEAKMGPKISPFKFKIKKGTGPKEEFSFTSIKNAYMPVPDLKVSSNASYLCERVRGATYRHQKENSFEKKATNSNLSPEKKRLKLGKKISPKHSRKKNIKQNSGTPELQKLFKRMNEKKSLPPKEIEIKEIKLEEKELKRKQSVLDLMKKFENIDEKPATPQKERKIMTPKRRKKKEYIPEEEKKKRNEECEERRFGTMSQNLEDLSSEGFNVK